MTHTQACYVAQTVYDIILRHSPLVVPPVLVPHIRSISRCTDRTVLVGTMSGRLYPWLRFNRYFFVVEAKDDVCGNIGTIGCAKIAELKLFGFVTKANEKLL